MTVFEVINKHPTGANLEIELRDLNNKNCKDLLAECKLFNNTITCHFLVTFPYDKSATLKKQMIFVQLNDNEGIVKPYFINQLNNYDYNMYNYIEVKRENSILNINSNIWRLICERKWENRRWCLRFELIPAICIPFKELYDDNDLTNFKLYGQTDDTEGVSFHSHVLAFSSPVLKSMLLGDWKETRQGNVQLPFVSKNTLRHLKEYIYLKSVPDLLIDCAKLLCLAGYYMLKQLPELKSDVATKLDSKFSPEDLWQWLEFCIHHKDTQMLVMLLHSLQYTGNWSIVDIEKLFLNGPYKALFELKPKCASSKYYYLYDDKDFVDFELRTGDDNMYSSVDIHRYVIAAFSPVLKQLFLNEWKGANHGYIQSIDISDLSIQHLKDFIYLNKIPEVSTDCAKLITFAACYNIPEMEKEAVLKIVDNLKPECFWEWIEYCVEQKHEYLLVEMLKSISILNKIDSIKGYLSKLYNSL